MYILTFQHVKKTLDLKKKFATSPSQGLFLRLAPKMPRCWRTMRRRAAGKKIFHCLVCHNFDRARQGGLLFQACSHTVVVASHLSQGAGPQLAVKWHCAGWPISRPI